MATAASSTGSPLSETTNPFQDIVDGVTLLVRRTFFNEAPTVNPVQNTGQHEGVITGTIGAVDPEGDPMQYSLSSGPGGGTVVLHSDGTYTYSPDASFTGTDNFTVAASDPGFHINLFDLFRPASTEASVKVNQYAIGTSLLTFTFIYGSGSDYWTPEARGALEADAKVLASYIVITLPINLTYDVTGEYDLDTAVLAYADSPLLQPGVFKDTVVQQKILTGYDQNGATADGEFTVNFANPWDYGDVVSQDEYDFEATVQHELIHTFGFLSWVDAAGYNRDTTWTTFDSFIVTSSGAHAISDAGKWDTAYNTNLTGGNGGLYFGGPNAVAAYGGLVPLFTPEPFDSGSSISHLDDSTFAGDNQQIMNAYVDSGLVLRSLSPIELGILQDLGYTVAPQLLSVSPSAMTLISV